MVSAALPVRRAQTGCTDAGTHTRTLARTPSLVSRRRGRPRVHQQRRHFGRDAAGLSVIRGDRRGPGERGGGSPRGARGHAGRRVPTDDGRGIRGAQSQGSSAPRATGREAEAADGGGRSAGMTRELPLKRRAGAWSARGEAGVLPRRGFGDTVSNQHLAASVSGQSWPPASGPPVGHVMSFQS